MKKFLLILLIIGLVVCLLVGCSGVTPPPDGDEGEGDDEDGEGSLNGDDVIDDGPSVTSPATKVKTVPSRPIKKVPVRRPAAK